MSLRIPPLLLTVLLAALMWLLAWRWPTPRFEVPPSLSLLLALPGLSMLFGAARRFVQSRTTLNPVRPSEASVLVVAGWYRYSRNPMYLGMGLLLLAWGLWLAVPHGLIVPLLFVVWMDRVQIAAEEAALRQRFGEDYRAYCRQVRRWC